MILHHCKVGPNPPYSFATDNPHPFKFCGYCGMKIPYPEARRGLVVEPAPVQPIPDFEVVAE